MQAMMQTYQQVLAPLPSIGNIGSEAASTLEEFEHWDAALHEAIAEAAHNGFISGIFKLMNRER